MLLALKNCNTMHRYEAEGEADAGTPVKLVGTGAQGEGGDAEPGSAPERLFGTQRTVNRLL